MRLSEFEIETIKELAEKHFGEGTTVYLFGSRTDENKKGGDIDLFITNTDEKRLNIEAKVQFLAELKTKIGDRKIDVVFDNDFTTFKSHKYAKTIGETGQTDRSGSAVHDSQRTYEFCPGKNKNAFSSR